jgi:hypothetical protein
MYYRRAPTFAIMLLLFASPKMLFAAVIDQPVGGTNFATSADIACNGTVSANQPLTIQLVCTNGNPPTVVQSANLTADGSGGWTYTFTHPSSGWSPTGNYKVVLWSGSTELASVNITIGL